LRLLVSVRSGDEVVPALAGGADIIDAKEPDRGSLGAVDRDVLAGILQRVPRELGVSVALGDVTSTDEIVSSLAGLAFPKRESPAYLKLGFAGIRSRKRIALLIETAVELAGEMETSPEIVVVAYADAGRSGTISPGLMASLAQRGGASGVLLDTHTKDGRGLLDWVPPADLIAWVATARQAGLFTALAGSLGTGDVHIVCRAQPDVVGIRGAACAGGRRGWVSEDRVCRFRQSLEGALQATYQASSWPTGETRDRGRFLSAQPHLNSRKFKA
jgi:uncharacterized protein (UPF0264 family)